MLIGDLARQAGIRASAIRYYEKIGLLPPAARTHGRRIFPADSINRLAVIQLAIECGFTLAETRQLISGFGTRVPPPQRWQRMARTKLTAIDRQIETLNRMRTLLQRVAACECNTLADCGALALAAHEPHRSGRGFNRLK
jgi:MerR family redox-sensitive transcriptional activator SoxR